MIHKPAQTPTTPPRNCVCSFEFRIRSGLVLSALDTSICSSLFMLALFHVEHNFSIWHLRNLATLEPKIPNVLGSKVKLLAHCCHDSVESLISTSDHIIDMHTEHSMDFSTPRNNAHGSRAQLVNPCSMIDFLAHLLIHTPPFSTAALFHDQD